MVLKKLLHFPNINVNLVEKRKVYKKNEVRFIEMLPIHISKNLLTFSQSTKYDTILAAYTAKAKNFMNEIYILGKFMKNTKVLLNFPIFL